MTTLKVSQWNIRHLYKNKHSLLSYCSQEKPNVICLQETWTQEKSIPKLSGFNLISHKPRDTGTKGGGVAIFASPQTPITTIPVQSNLEICAARIHSTSSPFSIISLYVPPNQDNNQLEPLLTQALANIPAPYLICTDLNGHHPNWGSPTQDRRGKILNEWIIDNNLTLLNNGSPTFETSHSTFTHIDLTISSPNLALNFNWNVHHENYTSDHFPISIESTSHQINKILPPPKFITKKADWQKFQKELNLPLPPFSSPTETCKKIEEALIQAAEKSIPLTDPSADPKYRKYWWTEDCTTALREKRKAFNKYKKKIGNIPLFIEYKKCKAKLRYTLNQALIEAWRKFTSTLKSDTPSSIVWKHLQLLMNKRKIFKSIVLKVNNSFIHSPEQVAETLAQDFSSRGSVQQNTIQRPYIPFFKNCNKSKYNKDFTINELERALQMGSTNTPGPDNIPPELYRHLSHTQKNQLLEVLNFFWNTGIPDQWKKSSIVPILKPNKIATSSSSYRPIALTNSLCKTMERIVNLRLKLFLGDNKILDPKQSGFRPGLSSLDGVSRLENSIRINQLEDRATLAIFLDISQAFDSINHSHLLAKCNFLGVSGNLACFIRNFIQNRFIKVKNQNQLSNPYRSKLGVPQGSVISPTLFNIFINDLIKDLPCLNYDYSKFADDVAVWVTHPNTKDCILKAQVILKHIEDWSNKWGLAFSPNKTKAIFFTKKRIPDIPLTLNNVKIDLVQNHKFLGLVFDRNLTWKPHIQELRRKCDSDLNLLRIIGSTKWGADFSTLKLTYNSIIQSKISYGLFLFITAANTNLKIIKTIQTKAARTILGALIPTRREHLYAMSNITPLELLAREQLSKYTCRVMTNDQNPLRETIINHLPPNNRRGLKYPPPLCSRIQKEFTNSELNFTEIARINFNLYNLTYPPSAEASIHQHNKDNLDPISWNTLHASLLQDYPDHQFIYTDGSVCEGKSGCGVWSTSFTLQARLPNKTSIFTCELYAIFSSLVFISTLPGKFLILSDSLSAIVALENPHRSKNHLVLKIAAIKNDLPANKISIQWIPSHQGIPGNEKADSLAKSSLNLSYITEIGFTPKESYSIIQHKYRKIAQKLCNPCEHDNYITFTSPNNDPLPHLSLPRHEQVIISRLCLRVTKLTHLHIITRSEPEMCQQCQTSLSLQHILLDCPLHENHRSILSSHCTLQNLDFNLDNLLNGHFPPKKLISFLKSIKIIDKI